MSGTTGAEPWPAPASQSIVHDRVDRALHAVISALADGEDASRVVEELERGTCGGEALPHGMPRLYYGMAVDRLRGAAGRDPMEEALELELDLGEAEKLLWLVMAAHAVAMVRFQHGVKSNLLSMTHLR